MNNQKKEIWEDIDGYKDMYQISDLGRVKSLSRKVRHYRGGLLQLRERIMVSVPDSQKYHTVRLSNDGVSKTRKIHKLVGIAFLNHNPNNSNEVVDHIWGDKDDNRAVSLQIITPRENTSKDKRNGTSKFIGVSWDKQHKKWVSQIEIKRKKIFLGRFTNELDAAEAYNNRLEELTSETFESKEKFNARKDLYK